MFPFPSNGKALADLNYSSVSKALSRVSIPFKRESPRGLEGEYNFLGRVGWVSIPFKRESPRGPKQAQQVLDAAFFRFQFPSNGKTLADGRLGSRYGYNTCVSIPFKRESPRGRDTFTKRFGRFY